MSASSSSSSSSTTQAASIAKPNLIQLKQIDADSPSSKLMASSNIQILGLAQPAVVAPQSTTPTPTNPKNLIINNPSTASARLITQSPTNQLSESQPSGLNKTAASASNSPSTLIITNSNSIKKLNSAASSAQTPTINSPLANKITLQTSPFGNQSLNSIITSGLVKNIFSNSSTSNSTINAAVAVSAAAANFCNLIANAGGSSSPATTPTSTSNPILSLQNNHPIVTTLMSSTGAAGNTNSSSSNVKPVPNPPSKIFLTTSSSSAAQNTTQTNQNRFGIVANAASSSSSPSNQAWPGSNTSNSNSNSPAASIASIFNLNENNITKNTIPINLKATASSNTANSNNNTSSLNFKPVSSTSSSSEAVNNSQNVNTKITFNKAPSIVHGTPVNQAVISSLIKTNPVLLTGANEPPKNATIGNIVNLNNPVGASSQTIAQLCTGLSQQQQQQVAALVNQFQLKQTQPASANANSAGAAQLFPSLQPIRLISTQQNVNTTTVTLSNSMLPSGLMQASGSSGSQASPSSSPIKPNIIRKPRRDSPSHSSLTTDHMYNNHSLHQKQLIKDIKHPVFELTAESLLANSAKPTTGSNPLSSIPIPTTLLPQTGSSAPPDPAQIQILSLPSTSTVSSSSSSSSSAPPLSFPTKTIVNLINDEPSKSNNLRKFTLTNTLPSSSSLATSSSSSSSASSTNTSNPTVLTANKEQLSSPSASSQPTSSAQPSQADPSSTTSRKRRKQEFKKQLDEPVVTYNKNPLSNNSALAYPSSTAINRYLNENTNINNTKLSSTNKLGHQSGKIGLKYDLFYVKNGDYFDDNDAAIINDDLNSSSQDYDDYDDLVEREEIVEDCNEVMNENNIDNEEEPASKTAKLNSSKSLSKEDACESDSSDESSACLDDESIKLLSKEFSYICKNGFKWAAKNELRPQIAITKYYKPTWKAKTNHYVKYSDIKLKDNNSYLKPSSGSITHRELVENLNEWKFHYVVSQVNNLIDYENESLQVINDVENLIQSTNFVGLSDICFKINESIKANSQRHKYVNEQLDETQILIHKLFDHKEKFKNYLLISSTSPGGSNGTSSSSLLNSNQSASNSKLDSGSATNKSNSKANLNKNKFKNKNLNTRNNAGSSIQSNNKIDAKIAK